MEDVKRLLIVDDEETITFSLYRAFIKAPVDCEVITAESGEEAWERIQEKPFDVVITDLAMPGMDGFELLKRLKQEFPTTRVIIITAYGSDEKEQRAYAIGADKYLEKPFDINELKNLVFQWMS